MVDSVTKTRAERADALEEWADAVDADDLVEVDTSTLKAIAELAGQREAVEDRLADAVRSARQDNRSWSEIGAMLGVTKQAAQQRYGSSAA